MHIMINSVLLFLQDIVVLKIWLLVSFFGKQCAVFHKIHFIFKCIVIENLRVNDILANFTVVQRYSVVRLLVDNILNHRCL